MTAKGSRKATGMLVRVSLAGAARMRESLRSSVNQPSNIGRHKKFCVAAQKAADCPLFAMLIEDAKGEL